MTLPRGPALGRGGERRRGHHHRAPVRRAVVGTDGHCSPRHGLPVTQETRVHKLFDDVASTSMSP
jgi:hypothetical protein